MDELVTGTVCPVCEASATHLLRKYRWHNPIFSACNIVECERCSMVFAHPVPGENVLREYNEGYFDNAHGGLSTHPLTTAFFSAISRVRMRYVQAFQQQQKVTVQNVLEIGPGAGYFAKHWLAINPQTSYTGVESDATTYAHLQSLQVDVHATLDDIPQEKRFDLVVISHVLEHTTDPVGFINACTRQLSPGGMLFIEVPCNDYQHKELDEPHLLFFDKKPMQLLLQKTCFTNIQLSYHGQTIEQLSKKPSLLQRFSSRLRNFLLGRGVTGLYASREKGLEQMNDPLERAVIKPFRAHVEQEVPAWWLRAIAIKK